MKTPEKPRILSGLTIAPPGSNTTLTTARRESVPKPAPAFKKPGRIQQTTGTMVVSKLIDAKYRWMQSLDMEDYVQQTGMLPHNKELLLRFVQDAKLGKTIKRGAKKKVDKPRLIKYVQDIKKLDNYFQKPLDEITQADMERFITDIEEGRFAQSTGKPYSTETKVCIKHIVIKFYTWLNDGKKPEIVDWIDTSYKIKDYYAPREEQIHNILDRMSSNRPEEQIRNRAIIMVLFDSGARADELYNVRLEHLTKENGNYKMRIAFSKTKPRTISLPLSADYLDKWLRVHPTAHDSQAQLFPLSYTALHHMIERAGKRSGIKMTPHTLRHAAATYWARHLSRYQLCQRMGWSMSSKQPDRYIDQEGLGEERVMNVIEQSNVQKLTAENEGLNRRMAILEEQLNHLLQADKEELKKIINKVLSKHD